MVSAILVTAQETFAIRCMSTPIGHLPCPHSPVSIAQGGFPFCILYFPRGHVLVARRQVQCFLDPFKSLKVASSSVCHPKATLFVAVLTYRVVQVCERVHPPDTVNQLALPIAGS